MRRLISLVIATRPSIYRSYLSKALFKNFIHEKNLLNSPNSWITIRIWSIWSLHCSKRYLQCHLNDRERNLLSTHIYISIHLFFHPSHPSSINFSHPFFLDTSVRLILHRWQGPTRHNHGHKFKLFQPHATHKTTILSAKYFRIRKSEQIRLNPKVSVKERLNK